MQAHTQITVRIVAIVIGAGALHAAWNAIAKYLDDRLVVFALIGIASDGRWWFCPRLPGCRLYRAGIGAPVLY